MSNIKRVKLYDNIAKVFIKLCGGLVILCVIMIIFMIFRVAKPLFDSTSIEQKKHSLSIKPDEISYIGIGEYLNFLFYIKKNGEVQSYDKTSLAVSTLLKQESKKSVVSVDHFSKDLYSVHYNDFSTNILRIKTLPVFEKNKERRLELKLSLVREIAAPQKELLQAKVQKASYDIETGTATKIICYESQVFVNKHQLLSDDFEEIDEEKNYLIPFEQKIKAVALDSRGLQLWVATDKGSLYRYALNADHAALKEILETNKSISCLNFIFGDVSVVAGFENGDVATYFPIRIDKNKNKRELVQTHLFQHKQEIITSIQPSFNDKSFLVHTLGGNLYLNHMTTEKNILKMVGSDFCEYASLAPRGDALVKISSGGVITSVDINNKHSEASFAALFSKVWYEDYPEPAYVWQSSSASNDAEPKLSLIPLIFGSLKGTLYAMLLSIPMALLAAIYISQFATPRLKSIIKPSVELMSAIPSVVVGFIAALWLAPNMDENLFLFAFSFVAFPMTFFLFLLLWNAFVPSSIKKINEQGYHILFIAPALILTFICMYYSKGFVENLIFAGEFKAKSLSFFGVENYDQRNCLIISFALGFTVIPLIFTIAEDVLSSVPKSLSANSLALGANRWQTVWRVILPSASPGIVAGVIIGFGRAIGETMIVLMATGNTPYIDISLFNGMRTLSANIATEIPEAPFEGTLYRVLFFSAVILFTITFLLNTVAELIRQALRKKYSQFL